MEMKTPGSALSCGARYVLIFMHIYLCLASRLGCVLQSVEAEWVQICCSGNAQQII